MTDIVFKFDKWLEEEDLSADDYYYGGGNDFKMFLQRSI